MTLTLDRRAPALGPTLADRLVPAAATVRLGSRSRDVALVAAGALLIALSAAVSIRLPDNPVPITGQTFGVLLVAGALGLRRGLAATTGLSPAETIAKGLVPFLLGDAAKLLLAAGALPAAWWVVGRAR